MIRLKNIKINFIDKEFSIIEETRNIKFVTTLNTELLLKSQKDKKLFNILNSINSIVTIDGQWLIFALKRKYKGVNITKNSGSDLIYTVSKEAKQLNKKLLILGSIPEVNGLAVEKLKNLYNHNDIYGFSPPISEYPFSEDFTNKVRNAINHIKPEIIITAFGVPKQEYWAYDNKKYLKDNGVKYVMFFGGAVDMVAGKFNRAPKILQKLGFEGIYRLILEPSRIKRYYKLLRIIPMIILNKL